MELLIAPAGLPRRELAETGPKHRIIAAHGAILPTRAAQAHEPARPAGTDREGGQEMGDDLPPLFGGHHFRPTTSLSIALSSERSATSFFNRRFSSSRAFNRLASA